MLPSCAGDLKQSCTAALSMDAKPLADPSVLVAQLQQSKGGGELTQFDTIKSLYTDNVFFGISNLLAACVPVKIRTIACKSPGS